MPSSPSADERRPATVPTSGWLAVGAIAAALAGPSIETRLEGRAGLAIGLLVALAAAALASILARSPVPDPGRRDGRTAALLLGAAVILARLGVAGDPSGEPTIPAGDGPWTAAVLGIGTPRDGHQVATLGLEPGGLHVAATLPRYPEIEPGDRLSAGGALEPLPADDGGYGTYLRRIGVAATLDSRALERIGDDGTAASAVERLRRSSGEALARSLPEPEAGLAEGILVGLRDRVDRDLAAAFTAAGVSHVVAISGWNIAIVAALVAGLLRRRADRRARSVVTLAAIVAYTVFAGASASVVRAAVMAAVVLLARESGRAGMASTALGWAVVVLLATDPATVADPGFQLSALATAGLIAWSTRITERLRRLSNGRLPGWLVESLGVSFAAEAATLPVVLAGFGRFAVLAPVVNLLVVPLVPPAMAAATLALAGGWLTALGAPAAVATVGGLPAWLVLTALVRIVRTAAALPFASLLLPAPWSAVAGGLTGIAIVLGASGGWRRVRRWTTSRPVASRSHPASPKREPAPSDRRARSDGRRHVPRSGRILAAMVALLLVAVVVVAANRPDGQVRVTVLDVGQGDAILVEGGQGGRMLVDGGPDPDRLLVALDARLPPWDRRIDLLVLTHPHEDHVAGLALLLARYRVSRTFEPGMIGPGPGYRAWETAVARLGLHPSALSTGDRFGLDEVRFRVLWPDRDAVPRQPADGGTAINNVSIVLLGEVGRQRFLLAGDIEEGIDPILVARGLPHVDLLKIAHHGSRTSSTGPFLDAVRPRVAIASAGAGNPYGHPNPATLERVAARGARVLRTDRNGSVEVTLDGVARLEVRPDRVDARDRAADLPAGREARAAGSPVVAVAAGRATFGCAIPLAVG